jgi:hypothetical protein
VILIPHRFCSQPQAIEKYRKQGGPLKCRQCVQDAEAKERAEASARRKAAEPSAATAPPASPQEGDRECAGCGSRLGADAFNRNQWSKGPGKSRCRACVDRAAAEQADLLKESRLRALDDAREAARAARESGGSAAAVLRAESALAALEAERVTGLRPQRLGGRGRGGRGGGGRGRAQGRGGVSR